MAEGSILLPNGVGEAKPVDPPKAVKPALWLVWHPESTSVSVHIDPDQVKAWDFASALLEMGKIAATRMSEMQLVNAARQQQQVAQLADQVMNDVRRPARRH